MKFEMSIDSCNAGMSNELDLSDALRNVIKQIGAGKQNGKVMDQNGNSVGSWAMALNPDEENE